MWIDFYNAKESLDKYLNYEYVFMSNVVFVMCCKLTEAREAKSAFATT